MATTFHTCLKFVFQLCLPLECKLHENRYFDLVTAVSFVSGTVLGIY
jgi:hypothetical protein